jgi:hypothetical protein
LFISTEVNESFPEVTPAASAAQTKLPELIAQGEFHSGAHETRGTASIYDLPDGKRVLRFSGFETSNGPDVNVYMVAADDAIDNDTVTRSGFVTLGPIKGTKGDQNYDLPADLDLNQYRAVTVWCKRFSVNFGTAPLRMVMQTASVDQPKSLKQGRFHSVAHDTTGDAAIYELANGNRVLRFTDFATSNGPGVNIYLVAAKDAKDSETVTNAGFVSLGPIKGTKGDQNYELPANLDLSKYGAVTVWCKRFSVNFGTAPLSDATMTLAQN